MDAIRSRVTLEVCVGSIADIQVAAASGADRVELCAAMELGGLTPSIGLIEAALAASPVPVIVMVRPRAGGFCYDRHEFAAMLQDVDQILALGAAGAAFGILDAHGMVDAMRSAEIVERVGSRQSVFHRAFDFVADQREALDQLLSIGCRRVLTSGGAPTALAGVDAIAQLVGQADGRIEVMAGGAVSGATAPEIVRQSGCRQIHIGASGPADDRSIAADVGIELCDRRFMEGAAYRVVVEELTATTAAALRTASLGTSI